jgi:hypothetical protein
MAAQEAGYGPSWPKRTSGGKPHMREDSNRRKMTHRELEEDRRGIGSFCPSRHFRSFSVCDP